ncbi:MAG: LptA/OstA family protein [Desulfovibrio sp.]|uniref:LptA/OstA family protein n=1 Tax=Desulfovibrio sp. 7SRBS1 TaxID=3378064 RepID=UPI003B3F4866
MNRFLLGICILCAFCLFLAAAAQAKDTSASGQVPTKITSEKLSYSQQGEKVVFTGDVHVKRPDFELWSDTLTAHLKVEDKSGSSLANSGNTEIEKIVATGHVRILREGRTGKCEKATYDMKNGVVQLEGNPVLSEGKNSITGNIIRLYTETNRSEVIGGKKKRVEAVFFTSDEKQPK